MGNCNHGNKNKEETNNNNEHKRSIKNPNKKDNKKAIKKDNKKDYKNQNKEEIKNENKKEKQKKNKENAKKKKNQMISPEPSTNDTSIKNILTKEKNLLETNKQAINKLSNNQTIIKRKKNIKKQKDIKKDNFKENNNEIELKKQLKDSIHNVLNIDKNRDYYFVCSRCKCRNFHIEKVIFDVYKKDYNVFYYCACFNNYNKPQEVPLELLIDSKKPSNICPIHSNHVLAFYCKKCKKSFCELCDKDNEDHKKEFVNYNNIMSEDNAKLILELSSKTKYGDIYRKIIEEYLNQFYKVDAPKYHLKFNLKGHNDKVTAIIQLYSGSIATGSYDKTIIIWDLELSPIKTIQDLGKVLALLEFEPNMLLSSNSENIIRLWDLKSNKNENIHNFTGHDLWVNCLIKYDDKTFASASNDCNIIIWDYNQRKRIKKFEAHDDCILALIKLKDGNLCSGSADKLIKIWDSKEQKLIKDLKGHKNWVKCLCQMENETILSGSDDKTIKVWKNYECIYTIKEHSNSVRILIKLNDNYFVSGSFDKSIKIWDINKFKCHQTLSGYFSSALCILKLNNNDLISSHSDSTIILWEK
jgi:WD40 repeat protein